MSTWVAIIILGGMGVVTLALFFYASFGMMFIFGAPWVATSPAVAREMLKAAGVKSDDRVLDLGCGHGVIAIIATKEFGAYGIGLDIHPGLIVWARWRALIRGVAKQTEFKQANLLKTKLPKADVVSIYLLEGLMNKLPAILVRDLDPLTTIVSHGFAFEDIKPRQKITNKEKTIYLYKVKDLK